MKIQIVWWWRKPTFKWWRYPIKTSSYYEHFNKPMFYGLYLGIIEIRFFSEFLESKEVGV